VAEIRECLVVVVVCVCIDMGAKRGRATRMQAESGACLGAASLADRRRRLGHPSRRRVRPRPLGRLRCSGCPLGDLLPRLTRRSCGRDAGTRFERALLLLAPLALGVSCHGVVLLCDGFDP